MQSMQICPSMQEFEALASRMQAAEANITSLVSRMSTVESNISSLGSRVSTVESENARFRFFVSSSTVNANSCEQNAMYIVRTSITNAPMTNHGVLVDVHAVGTPFQLYFPDNLYYYYKRIYQSNAWQAWTKMKTDS